jgi:hypothetical protein
LKASTRGDSDGTVARTPTWLEAHVDELGDWMQAPNPAFENQTPIQVSERGEADRIWRMNFQIDAESDCRNHASMKQ